MLYLLKVKNFAIIEDVEINFFNQMTCLTGKTGAGKSLLIDSISLLLGARADSTYIRTNENKAIVEGIFDYTNPLIDKILEDEDIKKSPKLKIYREISRNGKNTIKINDTISSLITLKSISNFLADIHSQFDTHKLINPDNYLEIIDKMDNSITNLLTSYQTSLFKYQENLKRYNSVIKKNGELKERLDILKYQYNELNNYNLKENEIDELEEEINKLKNYDKIYNSYLQILKILDEKSFLDDYYELLNHTSTISLYDPYFIDFKNTIEESYYNLEEITNNIKKQFNSLDFDPLKLENYQNRLYSLKDLEKKYNKNINSLIEYKNDLKFQIDLTENYDELLKSSFMLLEDSYKETFKKASLIHEKRLDLARIFSLKIRTELEELMLPNVLFKVDFNEIKNTDILNSSIFYDNGFDKIDFLIEINKGEGLKPLNKTASGGELSRIMLIIKSIMAKNDSLSLMVFDEIDTGVSGEIATKIAMKMKEISNYSQVLAITHLPQVASKANKQIHIFKSEIDNRTKFDFKYLNDEERIIEIAKMISGENYNKFALELSKDMLKTT